MNIFKGIKISLLVLCLALSGLTIGEPQNKEAIKTEAVELNAALIQKEKQLETVKTLLTSDEVGKKTEVVEKAIEDVPETAEQTIELISKRLLKVHEELGPKFEESPDTYYEGIDNIISPWINYTAFYKGVMGKKYYLKSTKEQRQKFNTVFKSSLIRTYGKGLLSIEDASFTVVPSVKTATPSRSVRVKQILMSGTRKVEAVYTMSQNAEGRWLLRNVVLEGINLGKTFRNQFARSAQEHQGDLDKVIENWAQESS